MSHEARASAIGALEDQLTVAQEFARPASPQKIGELLSATAEVFQVELPSDAGLEIYIGALSAVPERLLKKAIRKVCETHRFKSMPLIADIMVHVKDEMWAIGWLIETCELRIRQLEVRW